MRSIILMILLIKYIFASDSDVLLENENITKLDWSNKGLTSLKDYDFSKYPLLEEVDLSNNQLEHIATATFEKNKKIEKIDLSGNTKLRFPEYATFLSSGVKELNISNCNIKKTWFSLFDGLRYLKTLDLSNNPIKKKGLNIQGLSTIEKLEKLILPHVDKYTLQKLCTEYTYTILVKDKNHKVKTVDCTNYKKIESEEDDVSEKEEQEIAEGESNAKTNEEVQKPEVPPLASGILVDGFSKHEEPDRDLTPENKSKDDSPKLKEVQDSQKTSDVVDKVPQNTDEKPHLEPRVDGENTLTETSKTKGVENSINVPIAPENTEAKSSHTDEEKPNREPREDGKSDAVDESPDNSEKKPNPEPRLGENVEIGGSIHFHVVPEVVISEKPHTDSENPSVASEGTEDKKLPLKPIIDAETSDANATITEDDNKKVKSPQLLSENDKSTNKETRIESKEAEKVASDVSHNNMSEKMQTNSGADDKESEKVAEVTESSNTGSTILIVLVIAVVVAGVAAFGYKFYKNRTNQESEPVERELKEIVATKPLTENSVRDITEQEPLMNNHVNRENGNSKPNPIVSNNLSTGPYQPTTTTFKPIDQTDDK